MQVAADAALGLGEERDELASHVHRLDGADAEAAGRLACAVQIGGSRQKAAAKVGQIRPAVVVRAQVDAGEHNLTDAGFSEGHRLGHHLVGRSARRAAAGHVHDAVGARVVAAVLHLDADARAAIGGRCRERFRRFARSCAAHFQLAEIEIRACLGYNNDAIIHSGEDLRRELARASRDDDACTAVGRQGMAHGLAGLLLGLAGDRAGVYDDEVSRRFCHRSTPALAEQPFETVGLHAVHLAAQVHDRVAE